MMQYLRVDLGCSHVILDTRANGGGSGITQPTLAQFFGADDRTALEMFWASPSDNGNSGPVDLQSFIFANDRLKASNDGLKILPGLSEANYPGSVLQNGEFIFMVDTSAASGGDIFPNCFLGGLAQDGNLGGGVQTHMLGSVDGRLTGASGGFDLQVSNDAPRLKDAAGTPIPSFRTSSDLGQGVRRIDGTYLANRVPGLEIDPAQLTGKAGGNALWADWEELIYKDLGYTTNDRPILAGWTGPQTPDNVVVSNVISTTAGSNIVTVTMPGPHGFSTGDDVALGSTTIPVSSVGGLSSRILTGGQNITVTAPNTFTFQTSDVGTSFNVPGPSFSFTSPNATSTVAGGGGTFRVIRRSVWRDAWFEQAIGTVIANSKKKKRSIDRTKNAAGAAFVKRKTLLEARRSAKFNLREANNRYNRHVGCEAGIRLTHPSQMQASVNYTINTSLYSEAEGDLHSDEQVTNVRKLVEKAIREELQCGGMCLDSNGRLMATPTCKVNPRIIFSTGIINNNRHHVQSVKRRAESGTYETCVAKCGTKNGTVTYRRCILKCLNHFPQEDI